MSSETFTTVHEDEPGSEWQELFRRFWPGYERWFLSQGAGRRPKKAACRAALEQYMPEFLPLWQRLIDLAVATGAPPDRAARFLSLYRPTPYLSACSQAVWIGDEPVLVRNYDYRPDLWEGVLLRSRWHGRGVLAVSDCLWGILDGLNDAGLAVSLSFGGRRVVGDGFGIPLVLRYLLEQCSTTAEAAAVLARVPSHMAYNVTAVDASGDFITAYLAPDRPPILRKWPLCTNHQEVQDWGEYTRASASLEREQHLAQLFADPLLTADSLIQAFRQAPLKSTDYARGFGTLYTAVYYPRRRQAWFLWPDGELRQSI